MVSAQVKRQQVLLANGRGMSLRKACALIGISRTGFRYRPRNAKRDAVLSRALKKLSRKHPRYGYRFASAVLLRSRPEATRKRVYRLWTALGLQVPYRKKRRKIRTGARNQPVAQKPNSVWAWDFIFDRCAGGRQLKCFIVVDESTRECLAIDVEHSIRSGRVLEILAALMKQYGPPQYIRSDNGPEFIAKAIKAWLEENGISTAYIEPGKPWQNPFAESFNSRFRDESLNAELFLSLFEAKIVIEDWRREYNEFRPHSSLDYKTPAEIGACNRKTMPLPMGGQTTGTSQPEWY
jgi:putative transposase